eukprot:3818528-Pleurochrysis_carterae.AAC.1
MPMRLWNARERKCTRWPEAYGKRGGRSRPSRSFSVNRLTETARTCRSRERMHVSMISGGIRDAITLIASLRTSTAFEHPKATLPLEAARV